MNEKRIYLMIRLAIFEEHHREQLQGVRTCFRSDYIGRHMKKRIKSYSCIFMYSGWMGDVSCRDSDAGYYQN